MRDSFVFYRGFYESFSELSKKDKLALFDALCNYALNDVEPELTGTPSAIFKLLKPQVDANNRRYANGLKGGRPKKNQEETKPKPKHNQTETKPKRNDNDNVHVNDNVNDNVNVNVNDNDNDNGVGCGSGLDGDDFYNIWKRMSPQDVDRIFAVYPESGDNLIQAVYEDVRDKRKRVDDPVPYILGYAKNVNWDDRGGDAS